MHFGLTEKEVALQRRAGEFARRVVAPRAAEIDHSGEYPWDIVKGP